ncbi:MAG: GDSL-type esterase/lipase family protein [Bacteroidales bacterium]|nr:GDSL-type esterase/lipase family protein [Bacteroidales bacterium]
MLRHFLIVIAMLATAMTSISAENVPDKPKYGELYYQRASLFDALGVDSTTIVFLGNSLTHGCEWHELLGMPNVVNRGINGDIVEGIRERIGSVVAGKPAKIFLLAGANDVSHDLSADSIATAIGELVDYIREATPDTRLYVQSMLPVNNSFGRYRLMAGKEDTIRRINSLIEPMVKAKGATWINLHPAFCDADGNLRADLTNDGLHLLAPGYLIWRDIILPYVRE